PALHQVTTDIQAGDTARRLEVFRVLARVVLSGRDNKQAWRGRCRLTRLAYCVTGRSEKSLVVLLVELGVGLPGFLGIDQAIAVEVHLLEQLARAKELLR